MVRLFERNDSIPKLVMYTLSWVLLIALQVGFLLLLGFWVVLNSPITVPVLFVGLYLYQSKLIAYGKVCFIGKSIDYLYKNNVILFSTVIS